MISLVKYVGLVVSEDHIAQVEIGNLRFNEGSRLSEDSQRVGSVDHNFNCCSIVQSTRASHVIFTICNNLASKPQ